MGVDSSDQPHFRARFGSEWFTLGDALDLERLRGLVRRLRPMGVIASPPCEGFSTATFAGAASSAERLIAATRDTLNALGLPFVIENVLGARSEMREHAIIARGQDFGLRTERPRFLEAGGGFELTLDPALVEGVARYGGDVVSVRGTGTGVLIASRCPAGCPAAEATSSLLWAALLICAPRPRRRVPWGWTQDTCHTVG